jgi:opacity protein-like surface antigen
VGIGPRIHTRTEDRRFTAFGHALLGASHISATTLGFAESDTSLSWLLGAGADFSVTRRLAIRAQADLIRTNYFDRGDKNGRYSIGLVYRF